MLRVPVGTWSGIKLVRYLLVPIRCFVNIICFETFVSLYIFLTDSENTSRRAVVLVFVHRCRCRKQVQALLRITRTAFTSSLKNIKCSTKSTLHRYTQKQLVSILGTIIFWRNDQSSSLPGTPVNCFNNINHLLFIVKRPIDFIVISSS
jgi:hypothetical protein